MMEKPLSRQKLTAFLTAAKVSTENADINHYLYSTGRNVLADTLLAGLIMGEFDEDRK